MINVHKRRRTKGSHMTLNVKIDKQRQRNQISILVLTAYNYLFLNINQLDALNFKISLFQASTCFEHMCSSSVAQNCIIQSLVSSHL